LSGDGGAGENVREDVMAGLADDNQEDVLEQAVQRFVDAQLSGQMLDIEAFTRQYPQWEAQLKKRLQSLKQVDELLTGLTRADESDFQDVGASDDLVGRQLGAFQITEVIGRGGMGIVYKGQDTRLDRIVAVKAMPGHLLADSVARARFRREAKVLASLNHPNIGVIHDILEQSDGRVYLVLEYVPGQTLAERMACEPLVLKEALSIGRQIAEAVWAAHEEGVIHRDLKPGNIKITPDGRAKVLDFGLAKAVIGEGADRQSTITEPGRIIGTPAYMSPEQARGQEADRRTDIWSFGCVLYELLTGRPPFQGKTATDTLVQIIEHEPDWELLPLETPAAIHLLLRRCLEKDPCRRLRDIGDAELEISDTLSAPAAVPALSTSAAAGVKPTVLRPLLVGIAAVVFTAIAVGLVIWSPTRSFRPPLSRFPISLPQNQMLSEIDSEIAVSPDGSRLVYVGGVGAIRQLFLRELDQVESRELPETKGASQPFFSPDGRSIGFQAGGELKTLSLHGGRPKTLCKAPNAAGGTWCSDGTILFSPAWSKGLWRVSVDGGDPEQVTAPDSKRGESGHWWPEVLPGDKVVLFTIWRTSLNDAQVAALIRETGELRVLVTGASCARYAPTDHLLYAQSGTLVAAPFDPEKLTIGEPRPVIEGLRQVPDCGYAPFSFSRDGLLYYVRGGEWLARRQFVWVSRNGQESKPLPLPPHSYLHPHLSPDSRRLVYTKVDSGAPNIWLYDLPDGPATQLTFEGCNDDPIWTPDGNELTFQSYRNGPYDVYRIAANGSSPDKLLLKGPCDQIPSSWSRNGKLLLIYANDPETAWDIWLLPLEEGGTPRPLIREPGNQMLGVFSPDAHWIAYQSDREGPTEVYVTPYSELVPKKISTGGGYHPVWSEDGKELFYRDGDKMIAATVETEPEFRVTQSAVAFEGRYFTGPSQNYDVSRDGQRFLMIKESQEQSSAIQLIVVSNWFEDLRHLVPVGKGQ
jgi:serine/threonine protein kinase